MTIEYDSNGKAPQFLPGDRVYVHPLKVHATVIKQNLSWDYPESFWVMQNYNTMMVFGELAIAGRQRK